MKSKTTLAAAILSAVAATAHAQETRDHNPGGGGGGDPREIARAAYRAADDAEAIQNQARISCYGQGYQLSQSAYNLHMALSDLYYAARRDAGGLRTGERN